MRYGQIPNSLFSQNREDLGALLPDNSIAIFQSSDIMPKSADGVFPFKQNSDIFYLTGVDQEETVLVLQKNHGSCESSLYLRETSELIAIWEGHKLTKEQGSDVSGIDKVYWTSAFEDQLDAIIQQGHVETVFLNENQHARAANEVQTRDDRFREWFQGRYKDTSAQSVAPFMHQLRQVKKRAEIEMIKVACEITEMAFHRVLQFTRPGVWEYEIEAEIIHEFVRSGSRGHAYDPIIASGGDSCVLHYIANDKVCENGDILLLDFGAEYGNYNADLSRTIPVNGVYSDRQEAVYNAVLRVQREAIKMLTPGTKYEDYNKAVGEFMEKELVDLGLLSINEIRNAPKEKPAFRKYFMHGTSHSLGLDVHDVDDRARAFENGMVFTCEPGIYIPEEQLGVRIENNIVVNNDTPIDLMENIPIEVEEIETLMQEEHKKTPPATEGA